MTSRSRAEKKSSGRERLGALNAVERACLARYVELVRQRLAENLREVWLFGSVARGDVWRPHMPMHSDVDLLVICAEAPSQALRDDLCDATYSLLLECGRQMSPQFRSRAAFEVPRTDRERDFVDRVRREGIALVEDRGEASDGS